MATIAKLLTLADITGMTIGETKQVVIGNAHVRTGYFIGYDGSSAVSTGAGFSTEDIMQTTANTLVANSNYIWTLTKYSSTQYTIFVNGFNPTGATSTAYWSTTAMYYTLSNATAKELGSNSDMTTGYDTDSLIRFINPTTSGTYYLNSQSSVSALKYAMGTGEWSVWQVYEITTMPWEVAVKGEDGEWITGSTIYQKQGNCWWSLSKADLLARVSGNTVVKGSYTKTTNDEYLDKRLLVFEDDFDEGELNTDIWTVETGYCRNNNALAYYCDSAITFEDSNIVITATRTSGLPNAKKADGTTWALSWTSGSIQSQDKFTFQYGRVQAKIKMPKLKGSFPAFWLFGNDRKFSEYHTDGTILTETGTEWSECGEIDIMEQTSTNSHTTWNLWQSQEGGSSSYQNGTASVDPSEWHIYEIEWTPTSMTFMVDGNAVSSTIDITVSQGQAYVNDLFFIILNLNIGADGGTPDSSCNEMKMYCDWIRVYDYEKTLTATYSLDDNIKTFTGLITQTNPTSVDLTQGGAYETKFFPTIGYEFDTMSITMDGEDITTTAYDSSLDKIKIGTITGDVVISATTKIFTGTKTYKPSVTCPDNYAVLTIDENTGTALNGYTLNPGYNIDTSSTVVNIEFVMPTDYALDSGYTIMPIVPNQLNFNSGINQAYGTSSSSSDGYAGSYSVINDSSMKGKFPLWNITHWDGNNYFVFSLPIAVVGKTIEEVKEWLADNNIVIYYPTSLE